MFASLTFPGLPWYPSNMETKRLYQTIGVQIREQRKISRYTQEDLSRQIGISRAAIANIEAGRQQLLVHQLYAIARAMEVEFSALMPNYLQSPCREALKFAYPLILRLLSGTKS